MRAFAILALSLFVTGAAAQASPLAACRAITATEERLACYDAIPLTATAGPTPTEPPKVIETSIAGPFRGWWPKEKIAMTNGQVWQISDDSTGAVKLNDPKVRISRRMFGGYTLEIEGCAKAPSVKRVQ